MRYTKTLIILIFLATFFAACSQTNSDNTNYNLGIYQLQQGDYEKAIEFLSKAIEENPKLPASTFEPPVSMEIEERK